MASKLFPPLLEASIPAFYGMTVRIPFKHNPLVSQADFTGFKVQVKKVSGELVKVYDGSISEDGKVIVCSINYSDLNPDYSADLDLTPEELAKIILPNWYKFSVAYNGEEIGYYSTAAVGRFLGPIPPEVKLTVQATSCQAIYSHPYDCAEKAYSYRFILKRKGVDGVTERVVEDTGVQIHNINEDTKADESTDVFTFRYYIPPNTQANYELSYSMTTINGYEINKTIPVDQSVLSGVALTSLQEKNMFEIEAICNRDNACVELWAYPNTGLNSITGWFKVWRTSSKDDFFRMSLVSTFSLVNAKTRLDGEQIRLLLTVDKTVEAGYYYNYFIQQYNQYGVVSQIVSTMKDGKTVYVSYDDSFLWDGERQLRIKFNPKVSSFKANILQSKTETIGSKYPFITRNGIVNYKEFPISGLISLLMDENELFMTEEEKERLGVLPENTFRPCTPSDGSIDKEGKKDIYALRRHLRKNLERETPQNLVDININGEKDFKLAVLDFLNSNKPKLFRSATEGVYVVYTMNSSLIPNDALGRMLHTFNCTAYECESVEDFCNRYINNNVKCYTDRDNFISLVDLTNLEVYTKTKQVPYIPQEVMAETNKEEAIFDSLIDQRILDIDEYAKGFSIRDAKPLQQFKVSLIDIYNPAREIPDQIITIGSTGSYNYFCTDTNVYVKYLWPLIKGDEIGLISPAVVNFRYVFRIPVTDFDFLKQTQSSTTLATVFSPSSQAFSSVKKAWGYIPPFVGSEEELAFKAVLAEFDKLRPISFYTSSSFQNGTFTRIENNIEDIYLLRAFNTDPEHHHFVSYTFGNAYKIYEELGKIFTFKYQKKDNLFWILYIIYLYVHSGSITDEQVITNINGRLKQDFRTVSYPVSKALYQFCVKSGIGRLKSSDPKETSIFTFEQLKIEDRVKYMSKAENKNSFVYYNLQLDYDSLRLYYDNLPSPKATFGEEMIKHIFATLSTVLSNIQQYKTVRLIPPNGTMVLAAELPNIIDFCIWQNKPRDGEELLNDHIKYEISAQSRQNVYDFNDIKKVWEVYKENVV